MKIKKYAKTYKIKSSKENIRMCIWVCIQLGKYLLNRCKVILNKENQNKEFLNMEDENNYFDEYLTLKKLNLKNRKYLFNIKKFNIIILLSKDNNVINWLKNSLNTYHTEKTLKFIFYVIL